MRSSSCLVLASPMRLENGGAREDRDREKERESMRERESVVTELKERESYRINSKNCLLAFGTVVPVTSEAILY